MAYRQEDRNFDKGYGVILSGAKKQVYKKDAEIDLVEHILASDCVRLKEQYQEYCLDNEYSEESEIAKREFVEDFIDEDTFCGEGLGGMLAVFLNETECNGEQFFYYRDCCMYLSACVPVNEKSRDALPTQEDVKKFFEKHLNPLLVQPLPCGWVFVDD